MNDAITRKIDELEKLAKSRSDALQIPRAEGQVLYQIALASHARAIVEIGTSYGFSGLFWASALLATRGRLDTIDVLPNKHESAKNTFADAGLSNIVTCHLGRAEEVLSRLSGPFDIAFLDADKPATRGYFDLVWPKIRPGGSVITDNITTHPQELADFMNYTRSRTDAASVGIPIGNGFEWTIKLLAGESADIW
jgi:caffeoyl-CoA O-methyltransferase